MKSIDVFVLSNIGNVRDNHEDNFFVPKENYIKAKEQSEIKTNEKKIEFEYSGKDGVFVVCDGMGGHNAGEIASRIAVETISKKYDEILVDNKEKLLAFIKNLNNYICEYSEKNPDCSNMGTTFSGLIFFNDKTFLLHVGDSRVYKFEKGKLEQISKDHTEGKRLVDAGIIKAEDLSKIPNRKSLYKYLGRKGDLVADCEQIEVLPNSMIVISSDGLSDTLNDKEISETLSKCNVPMDVCHDLLEKCLGKGNACNDNVTIICIKIN